MKSQVIVMATTLLSVWLQRPTPNWGAIIPWAVVWVWANSFMATAFQIYPTQIKQTHNFAQLPSFANDTADKSSRSDFKAKHFFILMCILKGPGTTLFPQRSLGTRTAGSIAWNLSKTGPFIASLLSIGTIATCGRMILGCGASWCISDGLAHISGL